MESLTNFCLKGLGFVFSILFSFVQDGVSWIFDGRVWESLHEFASFVYKCFEVKETFSGCRLNGTMHAICNDDGVIFPILD